MSNEIPLKASRLGELVVQLRHEYGAMERRFAELLEVGAVDPSELQALVSRMAFAQRALQDALGELVSQQMTIAAEREVSASPAPLQMAVDVAPGPAESVSREVALAPPEELDVEAPPDEVLTDAATAELREACRRAAISATVVVRMHLELPTDKYTLASVLAVADVAARDVARFQLKKLRETGKLPREAEAQLRKSIADWSGGTEVIDLRPGSIEVVVAIGGLVAVLLRGVKPYLVPLLVNSGLLKELGRWPRDYLRKSRHAIFKGAKRHHLSVDVTREEAGSSPRGGPSSHPSDRGPSGEQPRVRIADGVAAELDVKLRRVRVATDDGAAVEEDLAAVGEELRLREQSVGRRRLQ